MKAFTTLGPTAPSPSLLAFPPVLLPAAFAPTFAGAVRFSEFLNGAERGRPLSDAAAKAIARKRRSSLPSLPAARRGATLNHPCRQRQVRKHHDADDAGRKQERKVRINALRRGKQGKLDKEKKESEEENKKANKKGE